jgi:hypothetical protein
MVELDAAEARLIEVAGRAILRQATGVSPRLCRTDLGLSSRDDVWRNMTEINPLRMLAASIQVAVAVTDTQ